MASKFKTTGIFIYIHTLYTQISQQIKTFVIKKASVLETQNKMKEVLLNANKFFYISIQNFINLILRFCQKMKKLKKKSTK